MFQSPILIPAVRGAGPQSGKCSAYGSRIRVRSRARNRRRDALSGLGINPAPKSIINRQIGGNPIHARSDIFAKMSSANDRPTYNREQIAAYFDRLKVPANERRYEVAGLTPDEQLYFLSQLQKHHLAEIPFENLTLHYSFHRQVSIDPEELFKKIVSDNNGRGGYCMENNYVLNTLLRSLGFQIYSAGARVFDDGKWSGW